VLPPTVIPQPLPQGLRSAATEASRDWRAKAAGRGIQPRHLACNAIGTPGARFDEEAFGNGPETGIVNVADCVSDMMIASVEVRGKSAGRHGIALHDPPDFRSDRCNI